MALVVRSERDFKLSQNSSGILGPGEYDNHQNQAPFNSKSIRYYKFSENINPDIGPGSYYLQKQRSFIS